MDGFLPISKTHGLPSVILVKDENLDYFPAHEKVEIGAQS